MATTSTTHSVPPERHRHRSTIDLYAKTEQDLGLKVHHTIGNHDVFGIYPASGTCPRDPLYGKKLLRIASAPRGTRFDHKGHHFIVLDSIGITPTMTTRRASTPTSSLARRICAQPAGTPIVCTHIPLVTAVA